MNNRIELPVPPHSKTSSAFDSHENVLLTIFNGKNLSGELIYFSPSSDGILIQQKRKQKSTVVPVKDIKSMRLINSRRFVYAEQYINKNAVEITDPPERQEYKLLYKDGGNEVGETLGYISDRMGVHLFLAQASYDYHHLFVPHSALNDYRIGAFIGEILVASNAVLRDDLDEGLKKQKQLRARKLGEYLTAKAIITQKQLKASLKKQISQPYIRLGEALIQDGLITENQLAKGLTKQKHDRAKPLGRILLDMGVVEEDEIRKILATKLGIPFVNLKKFNINPGVIDIVPENIVRQYNIMPLCFYNKKLIVAIENPMNHLPIDHLRFYTNTYIEPVLAAKEDIEWAIIQHYGGHIDLLARALNDEQLEEANDVPEIDESDSVLARVVNKMILDAYQQGASDIHIEPYTDKNKTIVRFRIDGTLMPYVKLPNSYRNALVSRLKIMSNLDIAERRRPQDGKIDFKKFGPVNIELRIATIPTAGGLEDVVLRVLPQGKPIPVEQLQLRKDNLQNLVSLVANPHGLFLVCGPTGSGKTTTLHSILDYINTPDKKIWTAEDPVEITQRGLRQLQVNPKIGLTFSSAMRSFLRADPDVIMVGEMRDEETASTGIQASLTGHLVISTLHTNSAAESVVRLLDMGMDPFNFADALLGILAQRLTKKFCETCKEAYIASKEDLDELYREYVLEFIDDDISLEESLRIQENILDEWYANFADKNGNITLYRHQGCDACGNTGYSGRIPLHELLIASRQIKNLIQKHSTVPEIIKIAVRQGMRTLKQDGIYKIFGGDTDIHHVRAVCMK